MWVALASILMMFTALSSAYIVRAASAPDWVTLQIPRVLWLSTALIVLSSVTIEYSKRSLKQSLNASYLRWLAATSLLGAAFLAAQLMAWRQFVRQGLYVASNPHSSFFYLLTATHGLHLIGGLLALIYLLVRSRRPRTDELAEARRVAAVDAVTVYWHFLDVLWLYLFGLLFFWR
jgi:cytochrome c oxidase subunit 3